MTTTTVIDEQKLDEIKQRSSNAADDGLVHTRDEDEPTSTDTGLFDASDYDREDLAIPKVDGNQIDVIRIKFAGEVKLDRSDPADVALFNRLRLNHEVELRASGKVAKLGTGFTTSKEGDLDAVVSSKTLKIDTVWVLDPEDLG